MVNPISIMLDLIVWLGDLSNALYQAIFVNTQSLLGGLTIWAFLISPTGLLIFVGVIILSFIINALIP